MAACSDRPEPAEIMAMEDGEELRRLLVRLHAAGPDAWRHDREAEELMRLCVEKYAALARKHGQEPADAAVAAFEVMRRAATRTAADPWAVVTVAVRLALLAEARACGLLTSAARARRPGYSRLHDVERFSDRAVELADYHPALQITDDLDDADVDPVEGSVMLPAVRLLVTLGWPSWLACPLVRLVCARTADIGSRAGAYEALRRDKTVRANLDVPHDCWIGLLRILLGHPDVAGPLGQGIIARLLVGDSVTDLLADPQLVELIHTSAPRLMMAGVG